MCVLSDHQPANHQEIERSVIGEITEGIAVNTGNKKGYCAQAIISELEDRRAQLTKTKSDTVMFEAKNENCDSAYVSKKNVCTTKAAVLADMDHTPPRVSHVGRCLPDWPRGCCIMIHGTSRAGLLWQPVRALTKVHCLRVTSGSFFKERRRIKLHDRQLGGLY